MSEVNTPDPLSQIGSSADLDSKEVEKLFNEAYSKELPDAPKVIEPPAEEKQEVVADVTPVVETPKVETTAVEAKKEEVKEAPPAAEKKIEDQTADSGAKWLEALPEDLRTQAKQVLEERERLKHQFESERQRVIALNRKSMNYANLERELAALRSQVQKPQSDNQIAAQAVTDANKSMAEWEQLISADPTLAKAVEQIVGVRVNAAIGKMDSIAQEKAQQVVAPLQANQQAAQIAEEFNLLLKEVPNAQEVLSSEQYKYWFETYASPGVRDLALRSIDHRDALNVLRVYERDIPRVIEDFVAQGKMQAPQPQAAQAVQQTKVEATTPAVDTTKADQVAKQREQKLTQAPVVQQAPPAAVPQAVAGTGAYVDLDDAGTAALFEQAYKANLRTR